MPRYTNANAVDTFVGFLRIPKNSFIDTESVFATLPSGVTKTADAPNDNPIISSQVITASSGDTTITIPDANLSYTIRIWCKSGKVSVAFNYAGATPALIVLGGEQVGRRVMNRTVGVVIVTCLEATVCKVDVVKDGATSWDV